MKKDIIIQAILEKQGEIIIEEPVAALIEKPLSIIEEPIVIEKPLSVIEEPVVAVMEEECYGGTMVNLLQKKVEELSELLNKAGIIEGQPDSPEEKVEYLCAVKQKGTCDPLNNLNCKDTDVCDISNTPGLCIKEELADKYVLSNSKKGLLHEGRKLIGTEKSVESFLKKIEKPVEGTEITDIEEILNQIQVTEEEELIGLTNVQKEVLKCLGLLGN